jgi:hypothetical protein
MIWLRLLMVLGIFSAGCGGILYQRPDKRIWTNFIHLNELHRGMDRGEVEGIMGPPQIKEEGDYRGGHYVFYFYLTHNFDSEGSETVRGGYTPLVFQKNRLVGIGKREYRLAVDRFPYTDESPSLPWRRTQ